MPDTWPQWISSSKHVAEAVDWVRWKTQGKAKIVIAIGSNRLSIAKNPDLDPEDAIAILEMVQNEIALAMREMAQRRLTHITTVLRER
jgi:DNA topoisomerase VI subunit B